MSLLYSWYIFPAQIVADLLPDYILLIKLLLGLEKREVLEVFIFP